ncbi:MAG TPA: aldehyde dehydrogenase family protein [Thermoleophilia bacterium]|nr:aldehyde dehydrogenase family protein [Thermoleophilia bacterium]
MDVLTTNRELLLLDVKLKPPVGSGVALVVNSPWDGSEVASIATCTLEEADQVLDRARAALGTWRWTPAWRRAQILEKTSHLIEENAEKIARIIALEGGKPLKDARVEARRGASTFRWASEEAKRTGGEIVQMDADPSGENRFGWTIREPRGVVLAISPFNFPLNLVAHKVAPALAAANVVVLKPASTTPLTSLFLSELTEEAGLPDDVLQVVVGPGSTLGTKLVKDERVNMVSFTGSPPVGRQIASDAGMKMVILELGNNSATIVDEDAHLDLAAQRIVAGGFANSGQVCISVQRVVVHEKVYDEFMSRLVPAVKALRVGDPLDETTDVAALISHAETERVRDWIREAVEQGATLAAGGVDGEGRLLPTVLTEVRPQMKVCAREVFGPVLSILRARDLCEAIEISNDSEMGLQAGIFTNDINKALYAARRLEVGGVMINEVPTFRVDHMPYGGVKGSGMGREGVKFAIQEMTEMKMVTIREMDWQTGGPPPDACLRDGMGP